MYGGSALYPHLRNLALPNDIVVHKSYINDV